MESRLQAGLQDQRSPLPTGRRRFSVRELIPSQRPRERLRSMGPGALSLTELVALVIGSGGPGRSALELADSLLAQGRGRLRSLARSSPGELEQITGVGAAISARLLAALELGRRSAREELPARAAIRGPADVFDLMAPRLRDLPHEEFYTLLLDTQHRVTREVLVTRGILDASLIHPREVFRPAILERSSAIILVHNHPSGDPSPSAEDRVVTTQMVEAGRCIGIAVLDHVIIADAGWASAS